MITPDNYGEEHIRELQQISRRDPQLIERALYALGLLEALAQTGMEFIFKGGSSLMLLLPEIMRLSTDVDIIVQPGTDVTAYIDKASKIFPFKAQEEQKRVGKNNVVKQHFKFTYYSPVRKEDFYILLDVLYEDNNYEELNKKEISNSLLLTEGENISVSMPSVDCILGDKLTAFAPYTTGIPLRVNKDLEVMKQFYDVYTLIDIHENFENVQRTFHKVGQTEIGYRGADITTEAILEDSISASIVLASRGKVGEEDYPVYVDGIHGVATHIYGERFSCEIASYRAANLIYMASCLLTKTPYEKIDDYKEYVGEKLIQQDLRVLSKMKKANPLQYAYLVKADKLLSEYRD